MHLFSRNFSYHVFPNITVKLPEISKTHFPECTQLVTGQVFTVLSSELKLYPPTLKEFLSEGSSNL